MSASKSSSKPPQQMVWTLLGHSLVAGTIPQKHLQYRCSKSCKKGATQQFKTHEAYANKIKKQTKNSWQLQNTFIHRSKTPKKNNTHKHILQQIHHHNNLHIYPLHLQPPPKKNGPYMVYAKSWFFQLPIEIPNPRHQAVVSPAILPRSSPRWWNAGRPASKTWPRPGGHGPGTKTHLWWLGAGEFIGDHGTFGCHVITINSSVTN